MGGCSQKWPSTPLKCLVLAGGAVLATGRLQLLQLNGYLYQIRAHTAETVLPNSAIGRGNPHGATQLLDGEYWVLLPRVAAPGG
jgi:hypothetical protein